MLEKKIDELISIYKQLLAETLIVKKEMVRVRGKLESNLYKTATKYNVITNDLLVVKNKYRGSIKCYKANLPNDGEIKFD
tara:strand:- start:7974 stop:8213 length:240 start_codon:yes stop_codon:yes gene_type:complete